MNPVLALVFSLVAPGAGQFFNGQYVKGIVLGILFALGKSVILPLIVRVFHITSERAMLNLFLYLNRVFVFVILYAVLDAFYHSFFISRGQIWTAILCAFIIVAVYKNTFNNFFFTVLSGQGGLYQILRPGKNLRRRK